MIRSTARQFLSARRGWSNSVQKSLAGGSSSHHDHLSNTNTHLLSKRSMSSSNPSGTDGANTFPSGDGFPSVDESLGKILPSFGSQPITPEIDAVTSTTTTATTTTDPSISLTIAQEIAAFEPTWWPSDQVLVALTWLNDTGAFPCFAVTIGATTLVTRALLFPLFVKGQANSSRMAHVQPELKIMKDELDKAGPKVDQATQMRYSQQVKALFRKHNCNPAVSILAPLVSMPLFMSMFFAMRNAPEHFPALLSTGGMLWFPDLNAADPYCIMPVLSAVSFLAMTEVGKEQMMATDPSKGQIMVNAFRAMAIIMVPVTMNFNSAIFCYWSVNNTWSFMQSLVLKQPAVKRYFGIWDAPKPVPGQEVGSIFEEFKKLTNKKKEDPNAWAADRVKAHNEIIAQQKIVKKKLMEKEGLRGKRRR
mmetsp:Transcript_1652/g.2975  ORF Transcript_1652/g.2975 Transcript_1652/m.2975 type:complete len:420 (+) Transcript_1652:72-1331(+)